MNQEIKINLTKLAGAFVRNLTGSSGAVKRCLVIPLENSGLYIEDGKVYIKVIGLELKEPKSQTHLVKLAVDFQEYIHMDEKQKNALPIIGGVKEFGKPK